MWRGLRAVTAAVLRALAGLLVRLSRSLEGGRPSPAEAAVDVELPPPGWPPPGTPPPPAHWVELVRERAPELLDGHHPNGAAAPARPARPESVPSPPARRRRGAHRIVEWSAAAGRTIREGDADAFAGLPAAAPPDVIAEARMGAGAPRPPPPSWEAPAPAPSRQPPEPASRASDPVPAAAPIGPAQRRPRAAVPGAGARAGIRVRAVVEEFPTPAPEPGRREPDLRPVAAGRRFDRPAPAAAGEPDLRWPSLPPSLEPTPERPALREWERVRELIAEQRGS